MITRVGTRSCVMGPRNLCHELSRGDPIVRSNVDPRNPVSWTRGPRGACRARCSAAFPATAKGGLRGTRRGPKPSTFPETLKTLEETQRSPSFPPIPFNVKHVAMHERQLTLRW